MTAITSIRLPKPVSADLTIKSDLALTNPIGKHGLGGGGGGGGGGVRLVDVINI